MQKFEVTIKNADGSLYWQQGFDSKREMNQWLNEEKTRTYWKKSFVVEVVDNSVAVEAAEEQRRLDREAAQAAEKQLRKEIKDLKEKKNKTLADAVALLEKIVDHLGIN